MFRILVQRKVNADIESVFNALADHENYPAYTRVDIARVIEPGADEKNGKGALRHMGGGGIELFERITEFQRPQRMHYLIERSKPFRIEHLKGEISLSVDSDNNSTTNVRWASEGRVTLPLIGPLLDRRIQKQSEKLFGSILRGIEQHLQAVQAR